MTEIRRKPRRFMKPCLAIPFPWFAKTNVNQSLIQKVDFERTLTLVGQDSKSASIAVKRSHEDSLQLFTKRQKGCRNKRIRSPI